MVENNLSDYEMKRIIGAMLALKPFPEIVAEIGNVFNVDGATYQDVVYQNKYAIIFKDYQINMPSFHRLSQDGITVTMQYKMKEKWWHVMMNPNRKIVAFLMEMCKLEFKDLVFASYTYYLPPERLEPGVQLHYFYDKRAFNGSFTKGLELSPLFIEEESHDGNCFVMFHFNSGCYERIQNKTLLKADWKDFTR